MTVALIWQHDSGDHNQWRSPLHLELAKERFRHSLRGHRDETNRDSELRRMSGRFEQHGNEITSLRAARTPMGQTTKTMTFDIHHDRRQMDRLQVPVCPRCDSVSRVRPKLRTREQVYFYCVSCGQYVVELKPDHSDVVQNAGR